MAPSLCGTFLTDKRSLVAFTWTITTLLTLIAFITALAMMGEVHAHYNRLEKYYEQQYQYYQYEKEQKNQGNNNNNHGNSQDRKIQEYLALASISSSSMTFVAVYLMMNALALNLYGSTAIVGLTSLRGVYIGPCFSSPGSSRVKLGMFGGAIVLFANVLLVCAVVFGEVRVEDWKDNGGDQRDEMEPYEVERIATILAVMCMFLSAVYTIFAILLFLYFGSDDPELAASEEPDKPLGSIHNDPRREKFITMNER